MFRLASMELGSFIHPIKIMSIGPNAILVIITLYVQC